MGWAPRSPTEERVVWAGVFTPPGSLPAPEGQLEGWVTPGAVTGTARPSARRPKPWAEGSRATLRLLASRKAGSSLLVPVAAGPGLLPSASSPASWCPGTWPLCLPLHQGLSTGPCSFLVLRSGAWLANKNSINICRNIKHFANFPRPLPPFLRQHLPWLQGGRTAGVEREARLAHRLEPRMQDQ